MTLIFLITCLSELNRTPFDLPEAESELVAGFMTEYSAFIFVAFFLFEYTGIVLLSSLTAILFFGGYNVPEVISIFLGIGQTSFLLGEPSSFATQVHLLSKDFLSYPAIGGHSISFSSVVLGIKVSILVFCVI